MKKFTALFAVGMTLADVYGSKKWLKKPMLSKALGVFGVAVMAIAPAYAVSEQSMQTYAVSMKASANAQNIGQIGKLIDDNAVISITRQGKTSTLDKNAYLQLLQKAWAGTTDYQYDIFVSDAVVSGEQVRATVSTVESWKKDGQEIVVKTVSKATLVEKGSDVVLLRAVSQIGIKK